MRLAGGSSVIDIWTEGGCGAIENAIIKDGWPAVSYTHLTLPTILLV